MTVEQVMAKVAALLGTKSKEELIGRIKNATPEERELGFFGKSLASEDCVLLAGSLTNGKAEVQFKNPDFRVEDHTLSLKYAVRQATEEPDDFLLAADSNELALAA